MATMLAMFSAQVETAQAEPYDKVRDSTVLADAAMRIIRSGTPARVRVRAINGGAEAFQVELARTLLDSSGLLYRVETPVSVPAGARPPSRQASSARSRPRTPFPAVNCSTPCPCRRQTMTPTCAPLP